MKKPIFFLILLFMSLSISCSEKNKAGLVIINGKVLTIDEKNPMAEAVAIDGGKIIAVGSTK